jgi:hypothetical protein
MVPNFLECDREQALLLPPSLREWLPENHLAWFVIDAVERLDLTAFYAAYRLDGQGRAAHEPSMMVAVLLYSYAVGERSSRRIEALRRGCGHAGDLRQPRAGSHDDRALPVSATRTRWPSCSARCCGCAPRPAWCASG